jgi:hypothetical protein
VLGFSSTGTLVIITAENIISAQTSIKVVTGFFMPISIIIILKTKFKV